MKIGFDAKRAVRNNTGLGNYSRHVIEVLSEYFPDNDYLLFAPQKKENPRLQTLCSRANVAFVFPSGFYRLFVWLWRVWGIGKDINSDVDIFHGLSNEIPLGMKKKGIKTVVSVHDLIFLRYPQFYKPVDRTIYRLKCRYACRHADRIIAVSECTKRDIVSFFHIPANKIEVVYQSCHPSFGVEADEERRATVAAKYGLPRRYLLNVGSIERRKNLLLVVKALKHLPDDIHLVAVGKSTPYQTEVETYAKLSGVSSRLHILNHAPFDDLPALYRLASVFVYPSFFEGFGIPVIEALTCGTPVVAARGSCLEEAGGPDSLYVDPEDETELAQKIIEITGNKDLAIRMREKGREYVRRFSNEHIATALMNAYGGAGMN
ncbi:MAG: glycosyltransferase family 4 protein [Tannerella sp.]|jgi:glycosyltransferase involved in cell wall biosynthesis|nr:glycosyltransferase family 4 protein [Tannerella sp.]